MTMHLGFIATANLATPGKYDDKASVFIYTGTWTDTSSTSAYSGSFKKSKVVGNYASITFVGNQFKIIYTRGSAYGNLGLYLDGASVALGTVSENSSSTTYQQVYTSPVLTDDVHTLQLKNATKYVTIDAIEILAPPDLIPPAPILDLSAVTGSSYGNVNLSWTATGDDGTDGIALSYDVRYSISPITNGTAWAAATKVTTGVPSPKVPGQTENMTVTRLTPGMTYYFAVCATDDPAPDSTPGGLSNSPSATASFVGPFGTGVYEDSAISNWMYVGTWTTTTSASAQGGSYHTSAIIGDSAIFVFEGSQFYFIYETASTGGVMNILVDGALVTSLNQKTSTTKFKQKYTSPVYSLAQHTVQFLHSSGSKVHVDALQIIGPPDVSAPLAIIDLAAVQGTAFGSVNLGWTARPEDATGSAPAKSYLVRYSKSDIVDETTWSAATVFANSLAPKTPGLTEALSVTGLYPGDVYYFSVREVDEAGNIGGLGPSSSAQAKPVDPVGTGTWDDKDPHWIYSGFVQVNNNSYDFGGFHRSSVIGSTATILITGDGLKLEFATASAYGNLEVWVDGVLKITVNQKSSTTTYKIKMGIFGMGAGQHTVVFKHASGTYVNIDAIIIP
jgi:hypothetical protein